VLDQELQKTLAQKETAARQARLRSGASTTAHADAHIHDDDKENNAVPGKAVVNDKPSVKRDFFGRVIVERPLSETDGNAAGGKKRRRDEKSGQGAKVWVTYHEGLNNAVRKPISLEEFMRGF
jgi:chromosome transmission fidelity protein 18